MSEKRTLTVSKEDWEPVDPSCRVPFELKKTVSPTRHYRQERKKFQNVQIASMSTRYTFIDDAAREAARLPGPASYRTNSFTNKAFKPHEMDFEAQARATRIADASPCNEYLERDSVQRGVKCTLPSVPRFQFSQSDRFKLTRKSESSLNVTIPTWISRSTSIGTRLNKTERFSGVREELPRVSKGKRWYDF